MIKRFILLAVVPVFLGVFSSRAATTFAVNQTLSGLNFDVQHLSQSLSGIFASFSGQIIEDQNNQANSSVSIIINTNSLSTSNAQLTNFMLSSSFLNAAEFPNITFHSSFVKQTGANTFDATGNLILHGVTRQAIMKATLLGTDPTTHVATWNATTSFNLSDFGLTGNPIVDGTQPGNDAVSFNLTLQANQSQNSQIAPPTN
jgi:polyisoprenoid-binding protein YceI